MKLGLVSSILADYTFEQLIDCAAQHNMTCVEVACWPIGKAIRRYAGVTHIDVGTLTKEKAAYYRDYAAQRVCRFLRLVQIAQHHARAGEADFAVLPGGDLLGRTDADDLIIGVGEGNADRAVARAAERRQAAGRDTFGRAVALADLHARAVLRQKPVDAALQLDGERIAAAENALQEGEPDVLQTRRAQQRLEQRRHAGDEARALFAQQVGVESYAEARHENAARTADERRVNADAEAEAVEHRHDREHRAAQQRPAAAGGDRLISQRVKVAAREADTLGFSGRAAGIEDHGTGVACPVVGRKRGRRLAQQAAPETIWIALRKLAALCKPIGKRLWEGQRVGDAHEQQLGRRLGRAAGRHNAVAEAVERDDGLAP